MEEKQHDICDCGSHHIVYEYHSVFLLSFIRKQCLVSTTVLIIQRAMIGYMQIASIIIEYIVERILVEKLLVSPFSTSLGVI